jgi:hypothetical protein
MSGAQEIGTEATMRTSLHLAAAVMLGMMVPAAAFAAGDYTIPSITVPGGGETSSLEGPGTIGPNGNGVFGSPGIDAMGLSPTLGATGAANGGVGGTSGGYTGTTGGVAGAPGGLAGGQGGRLG